MIGGRALFGRGAPLGLPNSDKLRMPINLTGSQNMGDKVRVRNSRPPAKVPKYMLSGKGCGVGTTRMLA